MLVIGLCGGSGSGKSTVCELFAEYGIPSIDADRIYHRLTENPSPCLFELRATFGDGILNDRGALDRKKLASIVFSETGEEKLKTLNLISHRHVLAEIRCEIERYERENRPAVLVDAPLLFESGFDRECDRIVSVIAKKEVRLSRIMLRDGIPREAAEARIRHQLSDELLRERSDFVIENDGGLQELRFAIMNIIKEIN